MSCSDWFFLLWVCPKRRPAPLPQLRVFKAWLGPGLGGCVVVPLPSEQTTEASPRVARPPVPAARVLSCNLAESGRAGSGRPGSGVLLPTVQESEGGPSILVGEQRDFQHGLGASSLLLRWGPSRLLGVHSQMVEI